jgi:hypothetical protein
MEHVESTAKCQIDEDANVEKNAKPHKIPDKDCLRKYLADWETKPLPSFASCTMCGHSLVDEPASNKDVARENKSITEKWEQDQKKVEEYLQLDCNPLLDAKGGIITKLKNPTLKHKILMCHCHNNCHSAIVGGQVCAISCYDSKEKRQYKPNKCPVCICNCLFVSAKM